MTQPQPPATVAAPAGFGWLENPLTLLPINTQDLMNSLIQGLQGWEQLAQSLRNAAKAYENTDDASAGSITTASGHTSASTPAATPAHSKTAAQAVSVEYQELTSRAPELEAPLGAFNPADPASMSTSSSNSTYANDPTSATALSGARAAITGLDDQDGGHAAFAEAMSATSRQAVHLKAFHAYAAAARDGSLTEARTATSPGANPDAGRTAIADWQY